MLIFVFVFVGFRRVENFKMGEISEFLNLFLFLFLFLFCWIKITILRQIFENFCFYFWL